MSNLSDTFSAPDESTLAKEARRVLRRMCEPGAVLAVAAEMDKAVVVRDTPDGGNTRTAVVDSSIAQAMALKDWIACDAPARISRYRITALGRTALSHFMAAHETKLRGFAETQAAFDTGDAVDAALDQKERDPGQRRGRYLLADSPLLALARRRGKDGQPFLDEDLVSAGERLREDFELAQIAPIADQNWEAFLSNTSGSLSDNGDSAENPARSRFETALRYLGPGLGDIALRCCCYLEGFETSEKHLGWSARSGKVVLRIALQRLKRHYEDMAKDGGDLIG